MAMLSGLRKMYSLPPIDVAPETLETAAAPTAAVSEAAPATQSTSQPEETVEHARMPTPLPTSMPTPLALPESAHQFLRPLVGFDTRTVPIYRDTASDHVTTAHNADAVTDGRTVVIASSNAAIGHPETLGLLAHELTHVARRQQARFIPPIARPTHPRSQPEHLSARDDRIVASLSEEALAQRVEDRVVQAVRSAAFRPPPRPMQDTVAPPPAAPFLASAPHASAPDPRWSGLPAPWEPMNDGMQHGPSNQATQQVTATVAAAPAEVAPPVVQRAGNERSQSSHDDDAAPPNAPNEEAPEADLDALARQVYAILKDRLSVERRRIG